MTTKPIPERGKYFIEVFPDLSVKFGIIIKVIPFIRKPNPNKVTTIANILFHRK